MFFNCMTKRYFIYSSFVERFSGSVNYSAIKKEAKMNILVLKLLCKSCFRLKIKHTLSQLEQKCIFILTKYNQIIL